MTNTFYSFLLSIMYIPGAILILNILSGIVAGCILSLLFVEKGVIERDNKYLLTLNIVPAFSAVIASLTQYRIFAFCALFAIFLLVFIENEEKHIEKILYSLLAYIAGFRISFNYINSSEIFFYIVLVFLIIRKIVITIKNKKLFPSYKKRFSIHPSLIVLLIFFIGEVGVLCFINKVQPVKSWLTQKFRQHITLNFNFINDLPASNGLPRLTVNTKNGRLVDSKENWEDASFQFVENGRLLDVGQSKIKGHGNSTWEMPKRPYTIRFYQEPNLLTLETQDQWVLVNSYPDKTLSRVWFAFDLANTLYTNMEWNPRCNDIELVLNNIYMGVYHITEHIKISNSKVNIPNISNTKNLDDGGFILEIGREKNRFFRTTQGIKISTKEPEMVSDKVLTHIQNKVQEFEDALYSENFSDPNTGWRKFMDEGSLIDWYLLNEFTKNPDANFIASVVFYYNPLKNKFFFGPAWDFDISSGNYDHKDCQYPEGFHVQSAAWFARLFEDETFKEDVTKRWNETKDVLYKKITEGIPQHAEYINKAQEWNFKAWDILNQDVWPNYVVMGSFQGEIDYLILWLVKRYNWMDKTFNSIE